MSRRGEAAGREVLVVWVGRHRRDDWERLCERYRERIARVMPIRDVPVRSRSRQEGERRLAEEAEQILAALPDPCWLVALDRRGKHLTSQGLAKRLSRWRREYPHPVAFVLGSDLGLGRPVLEVARLVLALSPMTFSHELARVVVYEQLYRAASIQAGTGYHRGEEG